MGYNIQSGYKLVGYIVRIVDGKDIIAVKASSRQLEEMGLKEIPLQNNNEQIDFVRLKKQTQKNMISRSVKDEKKKATAPLALSAQPIVDSKPPKQLEIQTPPPVPKKEAERKGLVQAVPDIYLAEKKILDEKYKEQKELKLAAENRLKEVLNEQKQQALEESRKHQQQYKFLTNCIIVTNVIVVMLSSLMFVIMRRKPAQQPIKTNVIIDRKVIATDKEREALKKRFSSMSDPELYEVIYTDRENFTIEAVKIAKEEADKRRRGNK